MNSEVACYASDPFTIMRGHVHIRLDGQCTVLQAGAWTVACETLGVDGFTTVAAVLTCVPGTYRGGAISGVSIDWLGSWIEANIAFFYARQYVPCPNSFVALAFTLDDSVPVACTSTALPRWKV